MQSCGCPLFLEQLYKSVDAAMIVMYMEIHLDKYAHICV